MLKNLETFSLTHKPMFDENLSKWQRPVTLLASLEYKTMISIILSTLTLLKKITLQFYFSHFSQLVSETYPYDFLKS